MNKFERRNINVLMNLFKELQFIEMKINAHYNEYDRLKDELYKIGNEIENMNTEKINLQYQIEIEFYRFLQKIDSQISPPPPDCSKI